MLWLKLFVLILVVTVTILAGFYPFLRKIKAKQEQDYPYAETFALGVFLGASLLHMLPDANELFQEQHFEYPISYLLAGVVFLLLLLVEHVGKEMRCSEHGDKGRFAYIATIMLSIHALLVGTALGLSESYAMILSISVAILAHKWAESFALAVCINKSNVAIRTGIGLFTFFTLMVPLGILIGDIVVRCMEQHPLFEAIFSSMAAGTFLYLGTLHGLKRNLADKCCDLKRFLAVLLGFALMAVVAIWV